MITETKRNDYFQNFIGENLFTKEASDESEAPIDDKAMNSPEFKENFAENYKEVIENEEEAHKEELKADGFYEKAVDEAFNKAIEDTKAEIRPITTEVEGILGGECDKCASETIEGLYKEAANRMGKELLKRIERQHAAEAALKTAKGTKNMVEIHKAQAELAAAKQSVDELSRFYGTRGVTLPGNKINKIEKGLKGEANGKPFERMYAVKDTGPKAMNTRSQAKQEEVMKNTMKKKPKPREQWNPTMASPGDSGAVNAGYTKDKAGNVVYDKKIKSQTKTPETYGANTKANNKAEQGPVAPTMNPNRAANYEQAQKSGPINFIKNNPKKSAVIGGGLVLGGGALGVSKVNQNNQQQYPMNAVASEVINNLYMEKVANDSLAGKVAEIFDEGMEKEAVAIAAAARGLGAAVKGISRAFKGAGGIKNMTMGQVGNAFKRGGNAFKNSFAHDAGAQNVMKAGQWIKNNPKKSMAAGAAGAFGIGATVGASNQPNPNGMQQTLASQIEEMFEKVAAERTEKK